MEVSSPSSLGVLDVVHREVPDALCNVLHHLEVDVDAINTVNQQHPEWNGILTYYSALTMTFHDRLILSLKVSTSL